MDPISFEFVTVEEARKILDGEVPTTGAVDWRDARQPPDPATQALTPAALKWLAQLPREVRPFELFHTYPRIANQLAALAGQQGYPTPVTLFLADLLIDKRGGRQGFPGGIAPELSRLQEHLLQSAEPPGADPILAL
ncbi:hypothetical protein [Cupriavidus sp. RAF20_2]|jgi:hypothetical protein|uniref:hypothetical protein n=1 Tax=Cupriavidus sp. RAF20_2 TaxID=3233053 RepID=UPI003F930911